MGKSTIIYFWLDKFVTEATAVLANTFWVGSKRETLYDYGPLNKTLILQGLLIITECRDIGGVLFILNEVGVTDEFIFATVP